MADVYLACTQGPGGFQKLLVVKLARFTGDPIFSTMFLDEARLAAQLSHTNVVQTYEVGEEGSRHYIVMEYLDGANLARLRQRASRHGGIPLRVSLEILAQVLDGLEYAHHARGIDGKLLKVIHRDLTPSNVIVTVQGVVKIVDFGIAKGVDSHSFTQTGRYSGKLHYMPPEQLRAEQVDGRADVFSVGVILAEALLGERFWGKTAGPMIASQLGQGQLPSLEHVPDLDPELRRICEKALAPIREDRYATAGEFKADLNRFLDTIGGPIGRNELADFVTNVTVDDRKKLQGVIDGQLQRISQITFGVDVSLDLPHVDRTPSGGGNQNDETLKHGMHEDDEVVIEHVVAESPTNVRPAPALPVARSAARVPIVVVLGAVIVVLVLVLALRPSGSPAVVASEPPRPPMMAAPTPAAPPPPAPVVPTTTRLEVIVSPPDATLTLDGRDLGTNPFVGMLPKDGQAHNLVVKAKGYEPLTRSFTIEQDLMLQLRLDAVPPPVTRIAVAPKHVAIAKSAPPPVVKQPAIATAPPAPPPPAETPPPAAVTPAPAAVVETRPKRALDGDAFDKKQQPTKRTLDSNVFDDNQKKPAIDRDNPWKQQP